jgi:FSR family fosmidomycin resistance protein-like MFS transporter
LSAFSAILVFAQELMPGKVGMISGFFFWNGRFGVCALAIWLIRQVEYVYKISSFLPY